MYRLDAPKPVRFCDGLSRRDFLHAGSLATLGLTLPGLKALEARGAVDRDREMNCILLFLVGGPSQLDTWDMKPDAPAEIRGPFRPIDTTVPGVQVSEIFPKLAGIMDKVALVRSVYHTATAVHDTGHQLMQTGRLFGNGAIRYPHLGSVLSFLKGPRGDLPPHVVVPRPIANTGGNMPHGQDAGFLGKGFDPFVLDADPNAEGFRGPALRPPGPLPVARDVRRPLREAIDGATRDFEASAGARRLDDDSQGAYSLTSSPEAREAFAIDAEPEAVRDRYGRTRFGQSCLLARRLVERGTRFVTVNMFETVFNEITWDIHGSAPFSPIDCYRDQVGPNFDNAYAALLGDLDERGMLDTTMVLAFGEFGRTPRINPAGGRDHHPGCWTALFAGGPVRGGTVVGASDTIGHAPKDRPVSTAEVAATVFDGLGIDLDAELPGPQGRPIRVVDPGVGPILELF